MSACKEPEIYLHDIHIHVRSISAKCTQGYQDILNIIYSRYTQKKNILKIINVYSGTPSVSVFTRNLTVVVGNEAKFIGLSLIN